MKRLLVGLVLAGAVVTTVPNLARASTGAAATPASGIPFKRDPESSEQLVGRTALSLLLCLAVGVGAIHLIRRRTGVGRPMVAGRRLQVIETQRLGAKASLVLVRWDHEELLLAQGEREVALVARAPSAPTVDRAAP
jgi:flagellar biogenesis protein FliO